jgi:quercetin dioxygenase-like cupin family protein
MSIERSDHHPTHESNGNTITSLAAPARGASEVALFRTELPPGGALPRHRHDHIDVFTVDRGGGTFQVGDERSVVGVGDSVVVPIGAWHHLEAGADGATITVAMPGGTKLILEDGSEIVPPWVG